MDYANKQLTTLFALDILALLALALVVVWQQPQAQVCAESIAKPASPGFESLSGQKANANCLRVLLR